MAHIKFESNTRTPEEKKAKELLAHGVTVWKDRGDCRNMINAVRETLEVCGVPAVVGTGGSHIWIHRADQHVEGKPVQSKRWAIITDFE